MMFRSQRGSAAAWVVLVVILLVAAGAVLYFTVFKDSDEKTETSSTTSEAATQSQQDQATAPEQTGTGGSPAGGGVDTGTGQGSGQAGPGSNVRDQAVVVSPPIGSGEEAFAAVLQTPEVLDWYWAVDDPRYEAVDSGSHYVVRLFAVIPAEGSAPARQAEFGSYRVDKQTGTVSEITK